MAGTNGKPKFLPCNREEEVTNLKVRGTFYQNLSTPFLTAAAITASQWSSGALSFNALTPNALTGPTVDALFQSMSQNAPAVVGETGTITMSNSDPVNPKVITLPAGWTPSTFTIPPNTTAQVLYQLTGTNPVTFAIVGIDSLGAANPATNTTIPAATFGADFALVPAQPFDVIVRNAANTQWVPSVTAATGGNIPWMQMGGTALPPGLNTAILDIDDTLFGTPITTHQSLESITNRTAQTAFNSFQCLSVASVVPGFGARGPGTFDVLIRTQLTTPPGIQADSYHFRSTVLGLGDVFHVRSSGVTKVTLSAGPPVTNIAVDALGQICAAVSSVTAKEHIINATDTTCVNDINVREYNYIGDDVKRVGAVVEEMEPLIPEALRTALINYKVNWAYTDEDGVFHPMTRDFTKPESINLEGVVFCLMKELQALRSRVALLEAP